MKKTEYFFAAFVIALSTWSVFSQDVELLPPPPKPIPAKTPLKPVAGRQNVEVPREKREQAYAKLLEGQRHIWALGNARTEAAITIGTKLAIESIEKAVELDPTLSEGYTALAELTYRSPPGDLDKAIKLAAIAVKLNPDNFGGHQILARLFTIKSRINRGIIDGENGSLAIREWEEIGRLDPRNAEAFAFLSEFYDTTKQPQKRIQALRKWLSSSNPVDSRFYRGVMQQEDLNSEAALAKLGAALLEEGETKEAVEILSRAVAFDPKSVEAIELLSRAIEAADGGTAATAIESLQQAIFASPENGDLPVLLAQVQVRTGRFDESVKLLRASVLKRAETNKVVASAMQFSLGDIYLEADRFEEAAAAYKSALLIRGIEANRPITDDDVEFAVTVYEKVIQSLKIANRPNEVKQAIGEAKLLFGKDDQFADKQLISFYRENGQQTEALQAIRSLRSRYPEDYSLLKFEASTLTDIGKVDEGVALVQVLIGKKVSNTEAQNKFVEYDDFINHLYISSLYSQAKRGNEAVAAANRALQEAATDARRLIARLTMATAQQKSGKFSDAEATLRGILTQTPGHPVALNNLGYYLLERSEKLEEALALIQKAVETDPTNPSYLDSLGWAFYKLDRLEEAEKYLKSALRNSSGSSTILEHLGDVFQKQGKPEMARSHWQKALRISNERNDVSRLKTKLQIEISK